MKQQNILIAEHYSKGLIKKMKRKKYNYIIIFSVMMVMAFLFFAKGKAPKIETTLPSYIGEQHKLKIVTFEQRNGIKEVKVFIKQQNKIFSIFQENINANNSKKKERIEYEILILPRKLKLEEGKALLCIEVTNFAWNANKQYIEKEIEIDIQKPKIKILSKSHSVSRGGTGLIIYRVSEPVKVGIFIGDYFYPGVAGFFNDKNIYVNYFAYSYKIKSSPLVYIEAKDKAENTTNIGVNLGVYGNLNKKDTLFISDKFLRWKLPQFNSEKIKISPNDLKESFVKVNNQLRTSNNKTILASGENPEKINYRKDDFMRMPKTKTMARFADLRSYSYKGKIIDTQTHLGIDLASVKRAPIPAANKGKIIFAREIGIYGNTVVIEHGFGLFSTYSHLSEIVVEKDQIVEKGDIIGRTGVSGLAGGDHLHYGVFIHNTFVNPVEWWDKKWVKNRIDAKIEYVKTKFDK